MAIGETQSDSRLVLSLSGGYTQHTVAGFSIGEPLPILVHLRTIRELRHSARPGNRERRPCKEP